MRSTAILIFVMAGVMPRPAHGQARPPSHAPLPAAQELLRLENGWTTALVKRDSAFFHRNLHPDYVYSDERGTFDKEQVIAEQLGGTDTVTSAENQNMRAHVHGSAAAVTGILIVRGHGKDGAFEHRYRYTDSFVREHGRWLMFASQDYEIPSR